MRLRELLRQDFQKAFEKADFLASPTSPVLPFKLGENLEDPLKMYAVDALTLPANFSGLPGISLPAGLSKENLPIGFQFLAPHWEEKRLLEASQHLLLHTGNTFQSPNIKV